MGCEVVRLEQKRGKVTAHYRTAAGPGKEEGDFLLCTIPFPVLAGVEADPPFSHDKRRAILEMGYDSGTKVALMTKNRFWEKKTGIYGGSTTTDLMSGAIIYPSDNARNKDGVEAARSCRLRPARRFPRLLLLGTGCPPARRHAGKPARRHGDPADVRQIHPELRERGMIIQRTSWAWDTYRWSVGTFAFYLPGQFRACTRSSSGLRASSILPANIARTATAGWKVRWNRPGWPSMHLKSGLVRLPLMATRSAGGDLIVRS